MGKNIFITGTDTGVGKTMATLVLGLLLRDKGIKVGVMKPVQCGGTDADFLKKGLSLEDDLQDINPCFAREALTPHVAFTRQGSRLRVDEIFRAYARLNQKYDVVLAEGAGGLMVPLKRNYFIADLIRDLNMDVVIVARLGLGTINHTLLTIHQARSLGLNVRGVIFNRTRDDTDGVAEQTNPGAIKTCGHVPVLGTIPFLKKLKPGEIVKQCKPRVRMGKLLAPTSIGSVLKNTRDKSRTRKLRSRDKKYLWHPFTQMRDWLAGDPLIIDRAQGCYLIDTEGRRYLDGVSSLWVNVHGHRQALIDRALKEQIAKLSHSTLLGLSNVPAIELAGKLISIAPKGLRRVFYSDNGSTAVEVALKMAYQYWQNLGKTRKTRIAHLANSYHGDTLGSVSVGGIELFHHVYRKLIFKTVQVAFPDCYRAPKGKKYPDYAWEHLQRFEQFLEENHATVAVLVVEPLVQGAAGMIVWPEGILGKFAELCRRYDILLIADEVATGFGRTGRMFACDHEGVRPDILCLAKGITGGYLPLAATLTTEKIFQGFVFDYNAQKTFFHGHTYTGNPLGCAAALANLEVFERERTLAKLAPKIRFLRERLQTFYQLPHVGDVRQKGFMVGIELVRDRASKEPYAWEERIGARVCQEVRTKGVILRPLGNVIVLMPPLAISSAELETLLEVTYGAIAKVTAGTSVTKREVKRGHGRIQ